MTILPIDKVIPESNLVMFAPHYDDFLLGLGGYILELKERGLLQTKKVHVLLLFSRSNYQTGGGSENFDTSLDRIKYATGKRLLEELDCLDELLGEHQYRYELLGERECFLRGKSMANSEMEFPHGVYEDFTGADQQIFERMKSVVRTWAMLEDTALVFPLAIKEHIDHFITREAGATVARDLGQQAKANFYFQEDKPYGGIANSEELVRMEDFIGANGLRPRVYRHHPEKVVELAFKHYISQVEEVYRKGVMERSKQLQEFYNSSYPLDRIFYLPVKK